MRERLKQLAGAMAIDVLDYAVLGNRLHVVLRNRLDLPCELGRLLQQVDQYRARLADISWFMRLACQPIARRANQEDKVDGRFFAKRLDCRRLETLADLLACSIYIDLNVIRAGLAETPETSEFTSAFDSDSCALADHAGGDGNVRPTPLGRRRRRLVGAGISRPAGGGLSGSGPVRSGPGGRWRFGNRRVRSGSACGTPGQRFRLPRSPSLFRSSPGLVPPQAKRRDPLSAATRSAR